MEVRSILVNIDIGNPGSPSLIYAVDLAQTFGAELIGLVADQPNLAYLGVDAGGAAVDFYAAEREVIERQFARAEAAFRAAAPASVKAQWCAYVATQTEALLRCAAAADLIVTPSRVTNAFGESQKVALGELVLGAGRPVLDVGATASKAKFDTVVIGWKDTREARRAVTDALPFLHRAKEVLALTVSEGDRAGEQETLADLAAWLAAHGITARTDILSDAGKLDDLLQTTALAEKADLLVTGAYGHTRMREWMFGGVTRATLETDALNRLLSN
jgi:nucleotide-binding universal stress UspA family protein